MTIRPDDFYTHTQHIWIEIVRNAVRGAGFYPESCHIEIGWVRDPLTDLVTARLSLYRRFVDVQITYEQLRDKLYNEIEQNFYLAGIRLVKKQLQISPCRCDTERILALYAEQCHHFQVDWRPSETVAEDYHAG